MVLSVSENLNQKISKKDHKTRVTIPRPYAHLMGIKKGDKVEIKEVRGVIKIL